MRRWAARVEVPVLHEPRNDRTRGFLASCFSVWVETRQPNRVAAQLSNIGNSQVTQHFSSQVYQLDDGITWTRGRHTLKFGGQYWFDIRTPFYSGNSGSIGGLTFGPIFTASAPLNPAANSGAGMADFLGLHSAFGRGFPHGGWRQTSSIYAGYFQDTWRVSDRLTLNLGLRYEAHTPWIEGNDLRRASLRRILRFITPWEQPCPARG